MAINRREIGSRLKEFLLKATIKQRELAATLGVPEQYITQYINGRLNIQNITDTLYGLGCNITWLLMGEGEMFADNEAGARMRSRVSYVSKDQQAAYHAKQMSEESKANRTPINNILKILADSDSSYKKPDEQVIFIDPQYVFGVRQPAFLKTTDDSMMPSLNDADYVVIDSIVNDLTKISNGDVIAITFNNTPMIRHYWNLGTMHILVAANSLKFPPIVVGNNDSIKVIGIVRHKIKI